MNHTLHSRESGQGPDVLLLHGLFGQSANLRSVAVLQVPSQCFSE